MSRTGVLCCAAAGVLALAVGCNLSADPKNAEARKEEAVKATKAKLDELGRRADELKDRADKAVGEEKAKLEARWRESAGRREALAKKYEELKSAAADKWEAVQKDAERAADEFRKAIE